MPAGDISTSVETRLAGVEKSANALLTAMSLVIDTLQQQTHLLTELAGAARETPETSPVVEAIRTLTDAIETMGEGIEALRLEMGELPARLQTVLTSDDRELSGHLARPSET
jgi:hypothetical protein